MTVTVQKETPLQDDVRELVDALNEHLLPLSPLEFQFKMSVEEMAGPETAVFVARDVDGTALGMGTLKTHGDRVGELKRMYTLPMRRASGVGSKLVSAIEAEAEALELKHLVLETGIGEGFDSAWHLYQKNGYKKCGAVLDYPDSGHSAFFEKHL